MRDVTAGEEVVLALNEVLLVPEDVVTGNGRTAVTSLTTTTTKDGSSVDETGKALSLSFSLYFFSSLAFFSLFDFYVKELPAGGRREEREREREREGKERKK